MDKFSIPVQSDYEILASKRLAESMVTEELARKIEINMKAANSHLDNIMRMQDERGEAPCLESYEYQQEIRWYFECLQEAEVYKRLIQKV